jgi:hypothetical protein
MRVTRTLTHARAPPAQELHGVRTEVVVQRFSDRTMVIVTQLGKMGTMVSVPARVCVRVTSPLAGALAAAAQSEPSVCHAPTAAAALCTLLACITASSDVGDCDVTLAAFANRAAFWMSAAGAWCAPQLLASSKATGMGGRSFNVQVRAVRHILLH